VAVERHLVGSGRFGNGFDPDRPYPMAIKEVRCDSQDALAWGILSSFPLLKVFSATRMTFPLK